MVSLTSAQYDGGALLLLVISEGDTVSPSLEKVLKHMQLTMKVKLL